MTRFTNTEEYSAYEVGTVNTVDTEQERAIEEMEAQEKEMEAFDLQYEAEQRWKEANPWHSDPEWQREIEEEKMERQMAIWKKEDEERAAKEAERKAAWKPATEEEMDLALKDMWAMEDRERALKEAEERAIQEAAEKKEREHRWAVSRKLEEVEEWMKLFPKEAKEIKDIATEEELEVAWQKFHTLWVPVKRAQDEKAEKQRQIDLKKEAREQRQAAEKRRRAEGKARFLAKKGPNNCAAKKKAHYAAKRKAAAAKVAGSKVDGTYKGARQLRKEKQAKAEVAAKAYQARMGEEAFDRTQMLVVDYIQESDEEEEPMVMPKVEVAMDAPILGAKVEVRTLRVVEKFVPTLVVEEVKETPKPVVEDEVDDDTLDGEDFLAAYAAVRGDTQFTTVTSKKAKRKSKKTKATPAPVVKAETPKRKRSNKRGTVLNIEVGQTYTEEKRAGDQGYDARCKGFEVLGDKKQLEKTLTRTSMCKSVKTGKRCPHGSKCRFAHNADELTIRVCAFGDRCRFAVYDHQQSKWVNRGGKAAKKCTCKHPGEEDADYFKRCGIKCPTQVKKAAEPRRLTLKGQPVVRARKVVKTTQAPMPKRSGATPWGKHTAAKPTKVVATTPAPVQAEAAPKKVIRVPAAMFEKTMEMLLARGMLDSVEIQCT